VWESIELADTTGANPELSCFNSNHLPPLHEIKKNMFVDVCGSPGTAPRGLDLGSSP
jgi:hypothetical protein